MTSYATTHIISTISHKLITTTCKSAITTHKRIALRSIHLNPSSFRHGKFTTQLSTSTLPQGPRYTTPFFTRLVPATFHSKSSSTAISHHSIPSQLSHHTRIPIKSHSWNKSLLQRYLTTSPFRLTMSPTIASLTLSSIALTAILIRLDDSPFTAHAAFSSGKRHGSMRTTRLSEHRFPHAGLNTNTFKQFPITKKNHVDDTRYIIDFQLPDELGLINFNEPLQYIIARYKKDGIYYVNQYYPFFGHRRGIVSLVVNTNPLSDSMGDIWSSIDPGDSVELAGPFYHDFTYEPNKLDHIIAIIATPSSISPIVQLLEQMCGEHADPDDTTHITIFYCNKSSEHALFADVLHFYRNNFPEKVSIYHVFDTFEETTQDLRHGFFEKNIIHGGLRTWKTAKKIIGFRSNDPTPFKILVCGPKGFVKDFCGEGRLSSEGNDTELQGWLYGLRFMDNDVYVI